MFGNIFAATVSTSKASYAVGEAIVEITPVVLPLRIGLVYIHPQPLQRDTVLNGFTVIVAIQHQAQQFGKMALLLLRPIYQLVPMIFTCVRTMAAQLWLKRILKLCPQQLRLLPRVQTT